MFIKHLHSEASEEGVFFMYKKPKKQPFSELYISKGLLPE
jgi:hypothetical protein